MKKWMIYGTVLLFAGILVACSPKKDNTDVSDELKALRKSVTTTSEMVETTTKVAKQTKSPATSSTTEKGLWDSGKSRQLNDYILQTWGPALGQEYKSYTPSSTGNFYGVTVPNQLLEVTAETATGLAPDFNGSVPYWVWSENGLVASNEVAVVAVYSDIEKAVYPSAHLYYFTIINGEPKVLITEQNQGNPERRLYFRETKNEELKTFFANLVNNRENQTAPATAQPPTKREVDTRNLTIEQCAAWAKAYTAQRYGAPYNKNDFTAQVATIAETADGLVYVEVRENHDTPNMRAAGADPHTSPIAGRYRINANGALEEEDIVSGGYQVVSSTYFE